MNPMEPTGPADIPAESVGSEVSVSLASFPSLQGASVGKSVTLKGKVTNIEGDRITLSLSAVEGPETENSDKAKTDVSDSIIRGLSDRTPI